MEAVEVKTGLVWHLKCRDCEANTGANGLKSVHLADEFITKHAAETGHKNYNMSVLGFTLFIEEIPCAKSAMEQSR